MNTPDIDDCYKHEGADGPGDGPVAPTLRFAFYIQPEQSNGFETFPAEVIPYVSEAGKYVEFERHFAEVAALKARIAELESERDDLQAELYEATNGD